MSSGRYTRRELATEIDKETEVGLLEFEKILEFAWYMMQKDLEK